MLFIKEYNAKSLDRSSVSMIDKYNTRLDNVDELLDRLSSLVDNLLSLIKDIRYTLGQSKQRVYNNLYQVKEVVSGNGITGTESTIKAIEDALKAGDKAIDEAEVQLENIQNAIDNSEEYCNDSNVGVQCGESPNEEADEGCDVCGFSTSYPGGSWDCTVCALDDCTVNINCDEPDINYTGSGSCTQEVHCSQGQFECGETIIVDQECGEITCDHGGGAFITPDDCTYSCSHSSECQQLDMPDGCTYTCTDGEGCNYSDDDCSYSTTCGQEESCNQIDCSQFDCGEPCGETCHMTTDDDGDCSEDSCGECSDELSDDDYYGGDDCGEACGEDCGDSCGL